MTDRIVVVLGGSMVGKTAAMAAALERSGVAVVLGSRASPVPDLSAALDALVLDAALVREVPQFARPLPILAEFARKLPKSEISQAAPRWLPRPREQRTRGKR